ncbi:MAG: hypothetical protein AAF612_07375 [Planctomycetota bacterium]
MLAPSRFSPLARLARMRALGLFAVAALVLTARPAVAADLPVSAVSEDSAMAIWADIASVEPQEVEESLTAIRGFLDTMKDGPMGGELGDQEMLDPLQGAQKFAEFRTAFTNAGGRAIAMIGTPDEFGDMDEPVVVIKIEGAYDPDGLKAAFAMLDDDAEMDDVEFAELEPGWLVAEGDDAGEVPQNPSAARTAELVSYFGPQAGRPMALVFVPTAEMKADMAQGGPGPAAEFGPALSKCNAMSMGVSLGGAPSLKLNAAFPEAQSATEFQTAYTGMMGQLQAGLTQFVQMMAGQQQPGMPPMPNNEQVQSFFGSLALQGQGVDRSILIDSGTLNNAASMLPLVMMGMMGGMGG